MYLSKTRRTINYLIFLGLFVFLYQVSDQATAHIDSASGAIDSIQARAAQ